MKPDLGVLRLLVVLARIGVVARKRMGATISTEVIGIPPGATPQQQSQQIQQQNGATVEGVMQQLRQVPDDK